MAVEIYYKVFFERLNFYLSILYVKILYMYMLNIYEEWHSVIQQQDIVLSYIPFDKVIIYHLPL